MALWVVAALVLSACGSTVQWSDTIASDTPGDDTTINDSLSGDQFSISGQTSGTENRGSNLGRASVSGEGLSGEEASREDVSGSNVPRANRGLVGDTPLKQGSRPGVTANEIYIGFSTVEDFDRTVSALGGDTGLGKPSDYARAIVKDINARGGVAGRKIVLVFHDTPTVEAINNPSAAAQRACAKWTNDRPVFAAIALLGLSETEILASCLSKQGSLYLTSVPVSKRTIAKYQPYMYTPVDGSVERVIRMWVDRLEALSYFKPWNTTIGQPGTDPVKIGILFDKKDRFAAAIIRQELNRSGRSPVVMYERSGKVERAGDETSQAGVKFRQAGVTHVLPFFDLFTPATTFEQQRYRPRYAILSLQDTGLAQRSAPDEQLGGALGIGWQPYKDVDHKRDPGPTSPAQSRCREIMKNAGQTNSDRTPQHAMFKICDAFSFLVSSIKAGDLSASGVQQGAAALGSMQSAHTFRLSFPRGRPEGLAAVRDLGYRGRCECFSYLSGNRGM